MQDIRSAGSAVLTSQGLAGFKEALESAQQQHSSITSELEDARLAETLAARHYEGWSRGMLLKHIMRRRFAELAAAAEDAMARRRELEQQLELSKLQTQFDLPDGVAKAFARFSDDFAACARSQRIWDNVAHRATNQLAERTTASRVVDLKPVSFSLGRCGIIETKMPVPRMENANGGDIFFYPGFVIYHASTTNYALIEYPEVALAVARTGFHEEKTVPTDAQQIGTTWAKTNKDGSPDRRFKDNYQIPVMQYARLTLKTQAGLNEEYLLSNVEATEAFAAAWRGLLDEVRQGR